MRIKCNAGFTSIMPMIMMQNYQVENGTRSKTKSSHDDITEVCEKLILTIDT